MTEPKATGGSDSATPERPRPDYMRVHWNFVANRWEPCDKLNCPYRVHGRVKVLEP
ncbi:MAG TPA: hypothetical protein VFV60_01760 [bacterium]|nr:hypothetical protein [bacterium]